MDKKIRELINSEEEKNLNLAQMLLVGNGLSPEHAKDKVNGLTLVLFFRLIYCIYNSQMIHQVAKNQEIKIQKENPKGIVTRLWYIPYITCMDGFGVSMQCNFTSFDFFKREHNFKLVEIDRPNGKDAIINEYFDDGDPVTTITIDEAQALVDRHGGINWLETLSVPRMKQSYTGWRQTKSG